MTSGTHVGAEAVCLVWHQLRGRRCHWPVWHVQRITTKYGVLFTWRYTKFLGQQEVSNGENAWIKGLEEASKVVVWECGVPWFFMCFTSEGRTAVRWLSISSLNVSLKVQWYWLIQGSTVKFNVLQLLNQNSAASNLAALVACFILNGTDASSVPPVKERRL